MALRSWLIFTSYRHPIMNESALLVFWSPDLPPTVFSAWFTLLKCSGIIKRKAFLTHQKKRKIRLAHWEKVVNGCFFCGTSKAHGLWGTTIYTFIILSWIGVWFPFGAITHSMSITWENPPFKWSDTESHWPSMGSLYSRVQSDGVVLSEMLVFSFRSGMARLNHALYGML